MADLGNRILRVDLLEPEDGLARKAIERAANAFRRCVDTVDSGGRDLESGEKWRPEVLDILGRVRGLSDPADTLALFDADAETEDFVPMADWLRDHGFVTLEHEDEQLKHRTWVLMRSAFWMRLLDILLSQGRDDNRFWFPKPAVDALFALCFALIAAALQRDVQRVIALAPVVGMAPMVLVLGAKPRMNGTLTWYHGIASKRAFGAYRAALERAGGTRP